MAEIHFGVVRIGQGWTVVGPALRTRSFATRIEAESVARRFAGEVIGRPVLLHVQSEDGELGPAERVKGSASFIEMQLGA